MSDRILAFMILHYGAEYLKESLLSVRDHVGKVVIAYSGKPSQGFNTAWQCPDTEEQLKNALKDLDLNGDGVIDIDEFARWYFSGMKPYSGLKRSLL